MKKHQFVKVDCNCKRRATYLKCKHCNAIVYLSLREVQSLKRAEAECFDPGAPSVPAQSAFKGMMGATFDCLAPDHATYMQGRREESCENC